MQLFMLLYSGRNAAVHPCKTFPMSPVIGGKGHKFKNAFFLKI